MEKQDTQMQMKIFDLNAMIPLNHLLRRIKSTVNLFFIYKKAAPYYSSIGRKSIEPVILFKMLLIGYLYGIKLEQRLDEKVSLTLAFPWSRDLDLMQCVPDNLAINQTRRHKFYDNNLFRVYSRALFFSASIWDSSVVKLQLLRIHSSPLMFPCRVRSNQSR